MGRKPEHGSAGVIAEAALRERVKELTCLYGIAQVAAKPDTPLDEVFREIAGLLPPAWQYPEVAVARIVVDGRAYATRGFSELAVRQGAEVRVNGLVRGMVEVAYLGAKPEFDEGPFLKEERNLIDAVARQIGAIVERREDEEDKSKLRHQLLHADRLATLGVLAAGVAHELNEPLGNILGFAQLARKCPDLPEAVARDITKIEAASLHAREIIKKLMVFARQTPPQRVRVDLNEVVEEGLYFFRARCVKAGVQLTCALAPDLPVIMADPAQLNQVLVNLVVNALHAMPDGGALLVETTRVDGQVVLRVQDTGVGMTEATLEKIFVPFFTTKDVGQGTGLGLPVVHGIVTAHGGTIHVDGRQGEGARFEIRFPAAQQAQAERGG